MKMNLALKQTIDEMKANQAISELFIMAVMNMDEKMIKSLLMPNRRYLGKLNIWETAYWFKQKFALAQGENLRINFTKGISLDYYPGAEYYEFRFVFLDPFIDLEDPDYNFGEVDHSSKCNFKIRLVLSFENGKIEDMRIPKAIQDGKKIECLTTLN
jgi:hypothetical protein